MPTYVKKKQRQAIVAVSIIALLGYAAYAVWSELGSVDFSWSEIIWPKVFAAVGMTMVGYVFRFSNWQYYLRSLNVEGVPVKESALIFFGGFGLGITPGKVGEIVRSALLKERFDVPVSRTASILVVDRVTDVLALLLIGLLGVSSYQGSSSLLIALAALCVLTVILFSSSRFRAFVLTKVLQKGFLAKIKDKIATLLESAQELFKVQRIIIILAISLLAWFSEVVGFILILQAVGVELAVPQASLVYAFSTLLGAVAFLPGGLGATEASLAGMLAVLGVGKGAAGVAVVLVRLATLWFGVLIGLSCLTILERMQHKKVSQANA